MYKLAAQAHVFKTTAGTFASATAISLAVGLSMANAVTPAKTAGPSMGSSPEVIEVKPGDTFSAIASRATGTSRGWNSLYRKHLSNLANPNLIVVGSYLELVTDSAGKPYLRVLRHGEQMAAKSATPTLAGTQPPGGSDKSSSPAAPSGISAPQTSTARTADSVLVIGVLPNISASTLATQYEHLSHYLERVDGQKVRVVISTNFKEFYESMMRGEFDLAVSAPHFARVAQLDRGMIPLVSYQPKINALLVAPVDSKVTGAKDLRERAVAFANPQSLVAMYGQQWLKQQGLQSGSDYEVKAARTDLGVGRMVLSGDAVAAIMSNGEFRSLPADESSRMRIVEVFARIPNFMVVANPKLDRPRIAQLKSELMNFASDPQDGAPFVQTTGFSALVEPDESQLKELDAFTDATRRSMSGN